MELILPAFMILFGKLDHWDRAIGPNFQHLMIKAITNQRYLDITVQQFLMVLQERVTSVALRFEWRQ